MPNADRAMASRKVYIDISRNAASNTYILSIANTLLRIDIAKRLLQKAYNNLAMPMTILSSRSVKL